MKKITRKALLTAKLYRPGKAGGGPTKKKKYTLVPDVSRREVRAVSPTGSEVGYLSMEKYGDAAQNNEAFKMAVKPAWQRQGIMTALHDEAEKHFGTINPSRLLSDDGFAFWKSYRPDAVKDSYRFHADKLMGLPVSTPKGNGIISSVGDKVLIAKQDDGTTFLVPDEHAQRLVQQVTQGQPEDPASSTTGDDMESINRAEAQHFADGGEVAPPQRTVKAYKLFRTKKNAPGQLFPLFVDANTPVPVGKWVAAKAGDPGKDPTKVKSKLGDLAFRPGWHAGDLPIATHIGGRSHGQPTQPPDFRPADQVWAEVEMPDDVDWQSVANSRARIGKAGEPVASTAHITDQVPHGGHYRYKTNPNMTGNWMIGGSMKVNRILGDDEVKAINDAAGVSDLPRHPDYPAKAAGGRTGYADGGTPKDPLADLGKLNLGTPARYVDPNNFYSKAHHEARKLTQKKGSPQQMRAMLEKAGVKPEEIAQSGYDEAFAGRPSVTSDEVASHFHQKRPNLKVERFFSPEHAEYEPEIDEETRFDDFTLHGQANYREHLLRLPPKEGEPFFTEDRHWPDYKNVVAHIRMGDRGTPIDQNNVRAITEKMKADEGITRFIGADPSKWASGAADFALERGTITKKEAQALSRFRRWQNDAMKGYVPERNLHVEEIQSDWAQKGRKQGFDEPGGSAETPSLPPAPFVTSTPGWTNLALKHILTEAVKGGYDRVVLSPGQANVDMYRGLNEKQQNGIRSFYDQVLPAQMNKLARSLDPDHPGMQMFSHTLPPVSGSDDTEGYKGHALDITPDLRDAVNKGLPTFKDGGEVDDDQDYNPSNQDVIQTAQRLGMDSNSIPALQEAKGMMKTHNSLMSDIGQRMRDQAELIRTMREQGKFPLQVGDRFHTEHTRANNLPPHQVKGYYVNPKNPEGDYGYHTRQEFPNGDYQAGQMAIRSRQLEAIHGSEKWARLTDYKPLGKLSVVKQRGGSVVDKALKLAHSLKRR